jgi:hypothetical protein
LVLNRQLQNWTGRVIEPSKQKNVDPLGGFEEWFCILKILKV